MKKNSLEFVFNTIEYRLDGDKLYTGKSTLSEVPVVKIQVKNKKILCTYDDSNLEVELTKDTSPEKLLRDI